MKRAAVVLMLSACALFADVTGKWSGEAGNGQKQELIYFNLKEDGKTLSGSGGPNEDQQIAIENGTVDGDHLKFRVSAPKVTLDFDLNAAGDDLTGEVQVKKEDGDSGTFKVALKRLK